MCEMPMNPAEQAAEETLRKMYACIDKNQSFLLEAGAGAGKTHSLIKALKHLLEHRERQLVSNRQQVACITFTNVAVNEIRSRTDNHPAIFSSTIHSFCWSLCKGFQQNLRNELPKMEKWPQILQDKGEIGYRTVGYDEIGKRALEDDHISLHHDDVLSLTCKLMEQTKFRVVLTSRYPVLLIDEYQDTDVLIVEALKTWFLDAGQGPLIGFFGDHWQKIYGTGAGRIEHRGLTVIDKEANFRSARQIVECLNRIRPELVQNVKDPSAQGSVAVYHTNDWPGTRRVEPHWKEDLQPEQAHKSLEKVKQHLLDEGWDFAPERTKILMLTHNLLALEQGYKSLADAFPYNEYFIKKQDPHIAFFCDVLEPVCEAYQNKQYGKMFSILSRRTPPISSHADKLGWTKDMSGLLSLRSERSIGEVLDHLMKTERLRSCLPDSVLEKQEELARTEESEANESLQRLSKLRQVPYQEVIRLTDFIDERTPFSTKHGAKGAEFENVLVVFGRGWNQYNFNDFLELSQNPGCIPPAKHVSYERNRNLFYVVCSRPKTRLALLFTQFLTQSAIETLSKWFGANVIKPCSK